jgi:hypothetical protein
MITRPDRARMAAPGAVRAREHPSLGRITHGRPGSRRWYWVLALVFVGLICAACGGGNSGGSSGSGGSTGSSGAGNSGGVAEPISASPTPAPAETSGSGNEAVSQGSSSDSVTSGIAWDASNCQVAQILVGGQVAVSQQTGLCRQPVTGADGTTFYQIYAAEYGPTAWVIEIGDGGGFVQWAFPNNVWLAQPDGGGATQILVNNQWEPIRDFAQQNPSDYYSVVSKELSDEAAYRNFLTQAITIVATAGQSEQLSPDQQSAAASEIQGLQQQNTDLKQQIASMQQQIQNQQNQQTVPADNSAAWEILDNTEERLAQNTELWTEPECYFSDNGCGP